MHVHVCVCVCVCSLLCMCVYVHVLKYIKTHQYNLIFHKGDIPKGITATTAVTKVVIYCYRYKVQIALTLISSNFTI